MKRLITIIIAAIVLAGCSSTPKSTSIFDQYRASQATHSVTEPPTSTPAQTATKTKAKEQPRSNSDPRSGNAMKQFNAFVTTDRKRMLQATTQIAMERNGVSNNTSSQLTKWTITSQELGNTIFWTSVTEDSRVGRVKSIFTWSGRNGDDLLLVYLLIGGHELVDNLAGARQKALE